MGFYCPANAKKGVADDADRSVYGGLVIQRFGWKWCENIGKKMITIVWSAVTHIH
jgi:hypothetical protein